VNWFVLPAGTEAVEGVSWREVGTGGVTVSWAVALMPLRAAVRVTSPPATTPVARPELLTVAMEVLLEVHVALLVTSRVEPSLYLPVAVNCCVLPAGTEAEEGVSWREVGTGGVTVSWAVALTPLRVAVRVTGPPIATPVARPELLTVAMEVLLEVHVALLVTSRVEPSLYLPVAVNWFVPPTGTEAVEGVSWREVGTGGVTVSWAVALTPLRAAVRVTGPPAATPVARPELFTVAMEVLLEVHVALLVTSRVEPLL
jgi:hypothetical protein